MGALEGVHNEACNPSRIRDEANTTISCSWMSLLIQENFPEGVIYISSTKIPKGMSVTLSCCQ